MTAKTQGQRITVGILIHVDAAGTVGHRCL